MANDRVRGIDRRSFLLCGAALALAPRAFGAERETLYNGIRLPAVWPPHVEPGDLEPVVPPYRRRP